MLLAAGSAAASTRGVPRDQVGERPIPTNIAECDQRPQGPSGIMIGIALLAGAVGSAFAGNANPATREFANHIAHDNTTHRW